MDDKDLPPENGYFSREVNGPVKSRLARGLIQTKMNTIYKDQLFQSISGRVLFLLIIEVLIIMQQFIFVDDKRLYSQDYSKLIKTVFTDNLTLEYFIQKNKAIIMYCFNGFLIIHIVSFALLILTKASSTEASRLKSILYNIHYFEFTLGSIPIMVLLTSNMNVMKGDSSIGTALSGLLLLIVQKFIFGPYDREYCFVNGRYDIYDSEYSRVTPLIADLGVLLLREYLDGQEYRPLILSSVFILTRVAILYKFVSGQWHYTSSPYRIVWYIKFSLLITMALYIILSSISERVYGIINLEALLFSVLIVQMKSYDNLYTKVYGGILQTDIYELISPHNLKIKILHLFNLYVDFIDRDLPSVELQRNMAAHIKTCKNPQCFCRILLSKFNTHWYDSYDQKKSLEIWFRKKMKYASGLEKMMFVDNKEIVERTLKEQEKADELIESRTHREYQKQIVKKLGQNRKGIHHQHKMLEKKAHKNYNDTVDVVDVGSFHFQGVLYSFLLGMSEKTNNFEIFYQLFSFCTDVLKNFGTVLVRGYILMYSNNFQSEAGLYDLITVTNYISKAIDLMRAEQLTTSNWSSSTSITQAFLHTKHIDQAQDMYVEIMRRRVELYELLKDKVKRLKQIVLKGREIFEIQKKFSDLVSELQVAVHTNTRLLCLVINFKINMAEESSGIRRLLENYAKLVKKSKVVMGATAILSKKGFNINDNNNLIMMHAVKSTGIRITYFTRNSSAFLKMSADHLLGMNIKEIMLPRVKELHDQQVLNYFNRRGERNFDTFGAAGFVQDGLGNLVMVNILVKLDIMINDDVYLASVIMPVTGKKHSMFAVFEQGVVPTGMSDAMQEQFPNLKQHPIEIYNQIPILIEMANLYFPIFFNLNEFSERRTITATEQGVLQKVIAEGPNKAVCEGLLLELPECVLPENKPISKGPKMVVIKVSEPRKSKATSVTQSPKPNFSRNNLLYPTIQSPQSINSSQILKDIDFSEKDLNKALIREKFPIFITFLKDRFSQFIKLNLDYLNTTVESMRETGVIMTTFQYRMGIKYVVVELKAMRPLESSKTKHTIREILGECKAEVNSGLVQLLMLEVNLIKSVCRDWLLRRKLQGGCYGAARR